MRRRLMVAATLAVCAFAFIAVYSRFQSKVDVVFTVERLWELELEKYGSNRSGALVVVIPDKRTSFALDHWKYDLNEVREYERFLAGRSAKITAARIRNPGGLHLLVEGSESQLHQDELQRLRNFAWSRGDRVNREVKTEKLVGRDGTTAMVVANPYPKRGYSEEGQLQAPVTEVSTNMIFKSRTDAEQAADYIDRNSYYVLLRELRRGGPTRLTAKLIHVTPYYDYGSDWDSFQRMAERFGGKAESTAIKLPPEVVTTSAKD